MGDKMIFIVISGICLRGIGEVFRTVLAGAFELCLTWLKMHPEGVVNF
jgi:hypothetical protein